MAAEADTRPVPRGAEAVRSFIVHLRLHYQVLILPGGYLLGGLYSDRMDWRRFFIQFFVVHVLLNGGVTAYNSFWDDDEGPIGGLRRPPKMAPWMHPASLALQLVGLALAWEMGTSYLVLYALTMLLSVLYSRRPPRWKGRPLLSLICVGVGTGTNTFLMGALAAGRPGLDGFVVLASAGVALLLLSLYPVSQVFQTEQDRSKGDRTFAVAFGEPGVRAFFAATYPVGLVLTAWTLWREQATIGLAFGLAGAAGGIVNAVSLLRLYSRPDAYRAVMRLKYGASLSFVLFLVIALGWVHGGAFAG